LDGWVCQDCKSVNSPGARNCYRCWLPRKFAEAAEHALPIGSDGAAGASGREPPERPGLADHRSSRRRSWILLGFLSVTVSFSALSLTFLQARGGSLGLIGSILSFDWSTLGSVLAISLMSGLLSIITAICWFVWFDRVLTNVPPLTGRWPEVGRAGAVAWWFVPVGGVFKGVFVVGHIYDLLAVPGSPGLWLLGMWGITWIGGTIAPSIVSFVAGFLPFSLQESARLNDLIANLGQISYIAAGFFAAALILAIEHARDVRASGRVAAAAPGQDPTRPADPDGQGRPVPADPWTAPVPQASAPAASSSHGYSSASGWQGPSWQAQQPPGTAWQGLGPPPWEAPGVPPAWQGTAPGQGPAPGAAWQGAAPPLLVEPVTNADPFEPPAAVAAKRERGPVPFQPLVAMGVLVAIGVIAGLTFAGSAPPPPDVNFDDPESWMFGLATPTPTRPAVPVRFPVSSSAPGTPAGATPGPTPRPVTAETVARRLVRTVTDDGYVGRMNVDARYIENGTQAHWTLEVGRVGDSEWRHIRQDEPQDADDVDLEQVILSKTVWERGYRTDWVRRSRVVDDHPLQPLFDLDDPAQLTFQGVTVENGQRQYRFTTRSGDAGLQRFIQWLGAKDGLWLRTSEVVATADGTPLRLDVVYVGDDGATSLAMTITYSDVGANMEVRSPREGPPLVVRES
jgi:hypothetical protein